MNSALTDAVMSVVNKLEWRYMVIGNKEGHMCPECYQFKPRIFPPHTPKRLRDKYDHKSDCRSGAAVRELTSLLPK